MTEFGTARPDLAETRGTYGHDPEQTGWAGWLVFASFMMFLVGSFQAIQGLVAIFDDGYYVVRESGLVVEVDYTVWGFVHLILGILLILCGAGVLTGNVVARGVGVLLAGLSALANMAFIGAYPVWSIIVIVVDVLVIYALTVHGGELKSSHR
jgi:hypothetical protein